MVGKKEEDESQDIRYNIFFVNTTIYELSSNL